MSSSNSVKSVSLECLADIKDGISNFNFSQDNYINIYYIVNTSEIVFHIDAQFNKLNLKITTC